MHNVGHELQTKRSKLEIEVEEKTEEERVGEGREGQTEREWVQEVSCDRSNGVLLRSSNPIMARTGGETESR